MLLKFKEHFLLPILFFCLYSKAHADVWHLKLEMPAHYTLNLGENEPNNNNKPNFETAKQLPGSKKQFFLSGLGVALSYELAEWIDLEVSTSGMNYSLAVNKPYEVSISAANNNIKHDQFTAAFSGNETDPPYCSRSESHFLNKQEICGSFSFKANDSEYVVNRLYTFLGGTRLKPFANIKMFAPYVSVGAGLAMNNAKQYKFDNQASHTSLIDEIKSNSFAFEIGGGSLIKLNERVALDANFKYFNYGKHKLTADYKPQEIKGMKINIGLDISLH
jgi:opacity protein-like surface antigen